MFRDVLFRVFSLGFLIFAMSLLSSPAKAISLSFQSSDNDLDGCHITVNGSWDVELKLYSLMGEAIESTRFRYSLNPGLTYVSLPALDGSHSYFKTSLKEIPSNARNLLQLYDVKIRFRLKTGLLEKPFVYLISDVGNPGKPDGKTWSFNVPGSPDWGRFLTGEPGGSYLSASDAKKLFASGLELAEATIVSCKLTEYELQNWYKSNTKWPEVRAMHKAYNYLSEAIRRSTGLNPPIYRSLHVNSTVHTIRDSVIEDHDKWLRMFQNKVKKLENLPDQFITDDNPKPYQAALAEVPKIIAKIKDYVGNWHSSDVDPSSLPQGYPPQVPGMYQLEEKDDGIWVIDSSGTRFMKLTGYMELLGGTHIIETFYMGCSKKPGVQTIKVINPQNGDLLKQFDFPCNRVGKRAHRFEALNVEPVYQNEDKEAGDLKAIKLQVINDSGKQLGASPKRCSGMKAVNFDVRAHNYRVELPHLTLKDLGETTIRLQRSLGDAFCLSTG
ncbi:hypothetical protein [Cohaesibacter celericrescens]|uniref:hypothetical protein n=1 Tax=Cohaesibacter celericrescens TaxID=2067669 RepID=UPI003566C79E